MRNHTKLREPKKVFDRLPRTIQSNSQSSSISHRLEHLSNCYSGSVSKFGCIGVLGKTNAGKSSLMNALVGEKTSIVSNRPQTTRRSSLGIFTENLVQIVFCDTPGFHPERNKLDRFMSAEIEESLKKIDGAMYIVDAFEPNLKQDTSYLSEFFQNLKVSLCLVINKIDLVKNDRLMQIESRYKELAPFEAVFRVSALKRKGLEPLLEHLVSRLPEGVHAYDPDTYTSMSEREIVEEIIREEILRQCYHEVPHSAAVVVSDFIEREQGKTFIKADIYLERESQKKIIVGSGGARIKNLGMCARKQLSQILDRDIFLELWAKVRPNWRNQENWVSWLVQKKVSSQ